MAIACLMTSPDWVAAHDSYKFTAKINADIEFIDPHSVRAKNQAPALGEPFTCSCSTK